jgi:hypothetical protein
MTLSIEDRLAILDLVATYNHALDHGTALEWVSTFVHDGTFSSENRSSGGTEKGWVYEGRDELKELYESVHARLGTKAVRHWNNNHLIEVAGDTASHSCYYMGIVVDGGVPTAHHTGIYYDQLKKTDDGWKFTHRRIVFDAY